MRLLRWKSGELGALLVAGALWGYLAAAVLYGAMYA